VFGVPTHPAYVGVTVIVEVIELGPAFIAVKDGILLIPLTARPIATLEFVQTNVAPAGVLEKTPEGTIAPGQYVALAGTVTVGAEVVATVETAEVVHPFASDTVTV
jgi:hypothetical protein